jgi:Protein of unknown function (DUF1573)
MLRIFLFGFMACIVFPASLVGQSKLAFDVEQYSFGRIKEEAGKVRYKFGYKNTGTSKVILKDVKPACGCTTADYSKDSILPGGRGYVIVQYDPMHRPGQFSKTIVVLASDSQSEVTLKISGEVIPRAAQPRDKYPFKIGHLRLRTNHFVFGTISKEDTKTLSTIIYNEGSRPLVLDMEKTGTELPRHLRLRITKKVIQPGDTARLSVVYYGTAKNDWGFCYEDFVLHTNDTETPQKKLNVSADIHEKFTAAHKANPPKASLDISTYDFGARTASEAPIANFKVTNTGTATLLIRKVQELCPCTHAMVERKELLPGESAIIQIEFRLSGRTGAQEKELQLITNDPVNPVQTIILKAKLPEE